MSSFTTPLDVRLIGFRRWMTLAELRYYIDDPDGESVIVLIGYETDLASVPRFLWPVLPPDGEYAAAAVVHDFLYTTAGLNGKYSKKQADAIFLDGMRILNVTRRRRRVMYRGVRIFGRGAW